jgi:hypothetical protein
MSVETKTRPTLPETQSREQVRLASWGRRAGVAALIAIVALAMSGALGQRTSVVRAHGGGYVLTVSNP